MADPFFHAQKTLGGITVRGSASCLVGHKIARNGDDKPDGVFGEWCWDGARLTARTDRYGVYPIFYYHRETSICLSTSVTQLIAQGAPSRIDEAGLAVFLRLGFFIADHTPFESIRVMPSDGALEWRDGELKLSGSYTIPKPQYLSRKEAIQAYVDLFRQAISRRLPPDEHFAVPLSGGRDSRHILLALVEAGRRPVFCATTENYSHWYEAEEGVASELAGFLKVPHRVVPQTGSRFRAEARANVETHLLSDEGSWYLPLADYLRGRVNTIYHGFAGGPLSGADSNLTLQRLELFHAGRFGELADDFLKSGFNIPWPGNETALAYLLRPSQYRHLSRSLAVDCLAAELKRHADAPNPVGSFVFWNRARREIALSAVCLFGAIGTTFLPYLDHDLFDFLASLPATALLDHDFHTDTIRHGYPKAAAIPYRNEPPKVAASTIENHYATFCHDVAKHCLMHRPFDDQMLSIGVMPRLARILMSKGYRRGISPLVPPLILYLHQLALVRRSRDAAGCGNE